MQPSAEPEAMNSIWTKDCEHCCSSFTLCLWMKEPTKCEWIGLFSYFQVMDMLSLNKSSTEFSLFLSSPQKDVQNNREWETCLRMLYFGLWWWTVLCFIDICHYYRRCNEYYPLAYFCHNIIDLHQIVVLFLAAINHIDI